MYIIVKGVVLLQAAFHIAGKINIYRLKSMIQ
jgi:hypothetical protein